MKKNIIFVVVIISIVVLCPNVYARSINSKYIIPTISIKELKGQLYEGETPYGSGQSSTSPYGGSGSSTGQETDAEVEKQLKDLQQKLADANSTIEELRKQLSNSYQNEQDYKKKIENLQSQVESLLSQLEQKNKQLDDLKSQSNTDLESLTKRLQELMDKVATLNQKLQEAEKTGSVDEDLKKEIIDVNGDIADLEKDVKNKLNEAADNSQKVNVGDTFKAAYIGYIVGAIIFILGVAVIVKTYIDNKKAENGSV